MEVKRRVPFIKKIEWIDRLYIYPLSSKVLAYPPTRASTRPSSPDIQHALNLQHLQAPQRSSVEMLFTKAALASGVRFQVRFFPTAIFWDVSPRCAPRNRWFLYVFVVLNDVCWFLNKPEIWCATSTTFQKKTTCPWGFKPQQKTGGYKPSKNREPRDASPWFRWSHCISNKYKAEFCVGLIWKKKGGRRHTP